MPKRISQISYTKPGHAYDETKRSVVDKDELKIQSRGSESAHEIARCLNCPLPPSKCEGGGGCYRVEGEIEGEKLIFINRKYNYEAVKKAYESGMTNYRMAVAFGVTTKTIRSWLKRAGLVQPKKKESENVALRDDNAGS